ncbi:MAG: GNAT family N-acetyltransferase [Candidatus Eremiobacteraeota bacterium]|nr:GNAT family N-acetyltransferase [Candidatus Eremiobacteraeota bacterium]MBV8355326.1 GNAT family N-acetyltransferase [Candidatus Eremiobacteraeota bacterium]
MTIETFDAQDAQRLNEALEIRLAVFVREQGVPLDLEIDEHDRSPDVVHALVRAQSGQAIATGRFYPISSDSVQLGRMAVVAGERGRGAGSALLERLLREARRRGYRRVQLDAQIPAIEFYRRAGFAEFGERFWDAGILHQSMARFWAED